MEVGLEERGAVLCDLDFGGFYDSEGGKVSCWAITFVTGPELGQSYTVAVFFPADAGYRALSLLLDPAQPSGENVSIFKRFVTLSFRAATQATASEATTCGRTLLLNNVL